MAEEQPKAAEPFTELELTAKAIAEEFMDDLRRGLKKKFGYAREGVHVSDLCYRQIVFRDLNPDIELSSTDINNFTSGKAIGAAIESISEEHKKYSTEHFTSVAHFISGHIDVFNTDRNIPIEFKSYRGRSTEKLPKWHQMDQLMGYMSGRNAEWGILAYQLLFKFDDGEFIVEPPVVSKKGDLLLVEFGPFALFVKHMTPEERIAFSKSKAEAALQFVRARAYGQPALAPHVMFESKTEGRGWLCQKCPFKKPCQDINAGAELK